MNIFLFLLFKARNVAEKLSLKHMLFLKKTIKRPLNYKKNYDSLLLRTDSYPLNSEKKFELCNFMNKKF